MNEPQQNSCNGRSDANPVEHGPLDRIAQRVFDCNFDRLDKGWEIDAIMRRYNAGERA